MGFRVFDLSNPSVPALLVQNAAQARYDAWTVSPYAFTVGPGGLAAFEVADPTQLVEAASFPSDISGLHPFQRVWADERRVICAIDGQGLRVFEYEIADSDRDGLCNWGEWAAGLLPNHRDSDGDGLEDGEEVIPGADGYITDPRRWDTDGDGLSDGEEAIPGLDGYITDPTRRDTDGDGMSDEEERLAETSPIDSSSRLMVEDLLRAPFSGKVVLVWSSVAGRFYDVLCSTNLLSPAWHLEVGRIPATPPQNQYIIEQDASPALYYRVRLSP